MITSSGVINNPSRESSVDGYSSIFVTGTSLQCEMDRLSGVFSRVCETIQESRAVARKPRDAAAVLFGLKFADNIHCKFKSSQTSTNFRGGLRKTHVFWNTVRNGTSRSSKVVDFGTNRNRVCDFLLVINSNLWSYLAPFQRLQVSWEEDSKYPIPPEF